MKLMTRAALSNTSLKPGKSFTNRLDYYNRVDFYIHCKQQGETEKEDVINVDNNDNVAESEPLNGHEQTPTESDEENLDEISEPIAETVETDAPDEPDTLDIPDTPRADIPKADVVDIPDVSVSDVPDIPDVPQTPIPMRR